MLETWQAEGFRQAGTTGKTEPLVLACRAVADPSGAEKEFVVKAKGLPGMFEGALYAEVFGNLLARQVGIATPTPALVDIPADLVPLIRASLLAAGRSNFPLVGIASGAQYLGPGLSAPAIVGRLGSSELEDAARIYAFDMAVQNPDRFVHRPNCLADGSHFIAIDFEMSFSFTSLLAVGKPQPAWKGSEHHLYPRQDHLFWHTLREAVVDWSPIEASVAAITADRLGRLTELIPADWKRHEHRIFAHLLELAGNAAAFIDELRRSLS